MSFPTDGRRDCGGRETVPVAPAAPPNYAAFDQALDRIIAAPGVTPIERLHRAFELLDAEDEPAATKADWGYIIFAGVFFGVLFFLWALGTQS